MRKIAIISVFCLMMFYMVCHSAYSPASQPTSQSIKKEMTRNANIQLIESEQNKATSLLQNRNIFFVLLGFWVFGLLMAFTPCILPLLIIMASFLGGKTGDVTKQKTILLALTYVIALSLTYAIAGTIAAVFGFYIQAYFQQAWIVIGFSFIFLFLALSLLGLYKLQLPIRWRHEIIKHNKIQTSYSYLQVAIMGILATLIASPCAAAPLIGVLSYVGKSGNVMLGSISLFFVGLGVGTPLLLATTIGNELLPKMPELQEGIKEFFGLVLMGISIWLLDRIIPGRWSMLLWSGLVMFTSIVMYRLHRSQANNAWKVWKTLSLMVFIYGLVLLIGAMIGNTDPFSPLQFHENAQITNVATKASFKKISNISEFQQAINMAKKQHKPTLLVFSASWCGACKKMDTLFLTPALQGVLQKFVLLQIDITDGNSIKLAKHFNVIAPPETLFFDENGDELNFHINPEIDDKTLGEVLQQLLKKNIQ